jgi:beta-glucosidase
LAFKNLNKSGKLEPYKDWRLSASDRAKDLASKLTIEEIAGLMLYSPHQSIPAADRGFLSNTFGGNSFSESGVDPWALSDQQIEFLTRLLKTCFGDVGPKSRRCGKVVKRNAKLCRRNGHGIPVNNSSDPRHSSDSSKEFNEGASGQKK